MEDHESQNLRAALYARVSTEEQREGQTIESQVNELERFVEQKKWLVIGLYKDAGWSGSILARPELDRLRDDASKGIFNAVLINDVDRLARDLTHLGVIKRDLERYGIQVIFRKLPTEKSPTNNLMVNILGSFAEFEREMIADRTRRGRRHKVEVRKQFLGTRPAYGFSYVPKDRSKDKEGYLEIVPEEAAVVRDMYGWVDRKGLSARKVVAKLNQLGVPTRNGGRTWQHSSVLRILRSQIYVGVWHYNKHLSCEPLDPAKSQRYRKSPKSSRRLRPRTEWLPVILPEHLRIMGRDQWERVQKQLTQNIAFSPRNSKHAYLLQGLVQCGGCSARYVGDPVHGKFYYRCCARCKKRPSIKEDKLNSVVWEAVEEAVLNPKIIESQIEKLNERRRAQAMKMDTEELEAVQCLNQLKAEESRLLEAYRMGILPPALLGQELEKLSARRNSLAMRKTSLSPQIARGEINSIKRSVREYCKMAGQRLKAFAFEDRQRFLRLLVKSIVFDGNKVIIRGLIPICDQSNTRSGPERPQFPVNDLLIDTQFGGIGTTKVKLCGHNPPVDFWGFFTNSKVDETVDHVPFELERFIPGKQVARGVNSSARPQSP